MKSSEFGKWIHQSAKPNGLPTFIGKAIFEAKLQQCINIMISSWHSDSIGKVMCKMIVAPVPWRCSAPRACSINVLQRLAKAVFTLVCDAFRAKSAALI